MGKLALVMERIDTPIELISAKAALAVRHHSDYWEGVATRLVDRDICETDESTLQLIPYVLLVKEGNVGITKDGEGLVVNNPAPRFFTYSRGQGGEEARLHGALSIGLGGHIDGQVPEHMQPKGWFAAEAVRELEEEVGLKAQEGDVIFADAMLYDPANAVGRVHVGILCAVCLRERELGKHEAEVVEHAQWLTLTQLLAPSVYARLEPWSQAAVWFMEKDRSS
jgi:predicted NUDIX family phosphoesterase